jgi:hypothetical protein
MYRSKSYLEFVRGQVCVAPACMYRADHAHHFAKRLGGGGVACKPHDTFVVPMCARHHYEVHQTGMLGSYFDTADQTEAFFFRSALQLVTRYLERSAA